MTVKELIIVLELMPENEEVYISHRDWQVNKIEETENGVIIK